MTTSAETQKQKFSIKKIFVKRDRKAYINPYLGGALLGLVLFLAFFIVR